MKKQILHWGLLSVMALLFMSGCAGKASHMKVLPDGEAPYNVANDKAVMVFMRPSSFAFAIQSSVYEIVDGKPEIIGIVAAKTQTAQVVSPGKHLYMVVGESADFMEANVEAGKTYYATVTPRMGFWKARFSFNPLHKYEHDAKPEELKEWEEACDWVIKTPETEKWFSENIEDIEAKYAKYYAVWKDKAEKPILKVEDGL